MEKSFDIKGGGSVCMYETYMTLANNSMKFFCVPYRSIKYLRIESRTVFLFYADTSFKLEVIGDTMDFISALMNKVHYLNREEVTELLI